MTFTKDEIKNTLERYDALYEKISDIVDLYGKRDECSYDIQEIEWNVETLQVRVEYYKWQDINYHGLAIDLALLTDANAFETFKNEIHSEVKEKQKLKEEKENEKKQREIEAAKKLLRENGIHEI